MSPHAGTMLVEEIAPRLRASLPYAVPKVGSEDHDELVQDATAMAARILASAEAKGKAPTPGNIAFYALRLAKAGRRSTGSTSTDVMHPGTQLRRRSHLRSLEEPVGWEDESGEPLVLGEVLSGEADDPSMSGARNLDWQSLLPTLDDKARAILECLAEERPLREVAVTYRISRTSVQTLKEKLKLSVIEFMGTDLMAQVQRLPRWKDNIRASRERLECRMERRA